MTEQQLPATTDFAAFLAGNRPATIAELSTELHDLVARIQDAGEAGSITLTVKIKPDPDLGVLLVTDEIRVRAPQRPRGALLAHVDPSGNLTTDDPNAFAMFRDHAVNPRTGEVR
ncbi:MAG: hypothetical protein HIU88_10070 [Acidobacteria bacterium]|nr:hypothetical protein [Acidobacteriota bacterium]